jgi:hypothetical protein
VNVRLLDGNGLTFRPLCTFRLPALFTATATHFMLDLCRNFVLNVWYGEGNDVGALASLTMTHLTCDLNKK